MRQRRHPWPQSIYQVMFEDDQLSDNPFYDLFTDTNYVNQEITMPSGRRFEFKALASSSTDPDLTGQIIWPGCKLLLTFIDKNLEYFKDKTAVEIGAGIAICSLFITKYGQPKFVTATDGSDVVIDLMNQNSEKAQCKNVECKVLSWGREKATEFANENGKFDIVFGSEIAYNENCIEGLVNTVDSLLAENGRFVIGHIDRYRQVTRCFFKGMDELGYELEREIPWDDLMDYKMELIVGAVYIFKRKNEK